MKKLLILSALVLAAVALPGNLVWAQSNPNFLMLYGVRGDADGITITTGFAKKLSSNFYILGYSDVGTGQNSASLEGAYIITKGKWKLGVLLGSNSDWVNVVPEENLINYMVFASGVLLSYCPTDGIQFWSAYKRKIPPNFLPGIEESQHKAMNIFGIGLAFGFGD